MTDKERILLHIINQYYPKYLLGMYDSNGIDFFNKNKIIDVGDLVLAASSGLHDFTIGYVVAKNSESEMTIREIGSKKTCNISNEIFYKIDKTHLSSVDLLEGQQYKTYCKVNKAISNDGYRQRFHSITFDNNICTVNLRRVFSNEISKFFSFEYNNKTTVKEIEVKLEDVLK